MTWFRSRLDIMQLHYISQDDVADWVWTEQKLKQLTEMDLDDIIDMPWAFMKLAEFCLKEFSYHQLDFYKKMQSF